MFRALFARKGEGIAVDELADMLKNAGLLPEDADSSDLVELLKEKESPSRKYQRARAKAAAQARKEKALRERGGELWQNEVGGEQTAETNEYGVSMSRVTKINGTFTEKDVEAALATLAGKNLYNSIEGVIAQINRDQRDKLKSQAAGNKTIANKFSRGKHFELAARIANAWEWAVEAWRGGDEKNHHSDLIMHRYVAAVNINGKDSFVLLTVKESQGEKKIYSAELMNEKKLRDKVGNELAKARTTTLHRNFEKIINRLKEPVKEPMGENGKPLVLIDTRKSFSEQSEAVKRGLKEAFGINDDEQLAGKTWKALYDEFAKKTGSYKAAAEAMRKHGIEGTFSTGEYGGRIITKFDDKSFDAENPNIFFQKEVGGEMSTEAAEARAALDEEEKNWWPEPQFITREDAVRLDAEDGGHKREKAFKKAESLASRGKTEEQIYNRTRVKKDENGNWVLEDNTARTRLEEDIANWNRTVDKINTPVKDETSVKIPSSSVQMLRQTPLILRLLGADTLTGKAAAKGGIYVAPHFFDGSHSNIKPEMQKQIPKALANPIAVFDSDNPKNRANGDLVFMLGFTDASGATVVVPVNISGSTDVPGVTVNMITSTYAKENGGIPSNGWFKDQAKRNARYINGHKMRLWQASAGVYFPFTLLGNTSGNQIYTEADLVKLKNQNRGYYQNNAAPRAVPAGQITTTASGEYVIQLFRGANLSTLVHEASHAFFLEMERIEAEGRGTEALKRDLAALRRWTAAMDDPANLKKEYDKYQKALYNGRDFESLSAEELEAVRALSTRRNCSCLIRSGIGCQTPTRIGNWRT